MKNSGFAKYGHIRLGPITIQYNRKSLYKAISWRCISIIVAYTLNFIFLQDASKAGKLTILGALIGTVLYYGHERFWAVVRRKKWLKI